MIRYHVIIARFRRLAVNTSIWLAQGPYFVMGLFFNFSMSELAHDAPRPAPLDAVHDIAFFEQQLGQIYAVLPVEPVIKATPP
jgi:hypothetical protein